MPQIVSYDYGAHNTALARGQHTHGNTWKKARVIMIIPAAALIPAKVYLAHRSLIFPPNQGMFPMLVTGCEVGDAYSRAIEAVLAHPDLSQWEYVLTIEHDNIPPPDGVLKLIRRMEDNPQFACIGGLYWCKGPGGCVHQWGDRSDPVMNFRPVPPRPGQLVETWGTSMGFNLWRLSMFKDARLPRPLFQTKAGPGGVGTQDLAFWAEAQKLGYRCAVDNDCLVGHYDFDGKIGGIPDFTW
jgi:hypothetical protein